MIEGLLLFGLSVALSAVAFVVIAALWLRRLRATVLASLAENADRQIRSAERVDESLSQLREHQAVCARQIRALTEGEIQLQRQIATIAHRIESAPADPMADTHTVH